MVRRLCVGLTLAVAACLGGAITSHATTVTYNGFGSTAGLSFAGSAGTATTSDGTVLRLTSAAGNQAGAAYSTSAITLGSNATFSTTFKFRFTNPSAVPADGITFVLAASPSGLGSTGQDLGYGGVGNSVAVEFDTYNNGPTDANSSSNHVGIDTNGTNFDTTYGYPGGVSGCTGSGPWCMANGDLWSVTIGYNGSDLSVAVQDGSLAAQTVINNYAINIASYLGTNTAYVGFTGATGADYENQDITTWSFSNTTALAASLVPEPSAFAVLGVAVLGLAGLRRRQAQGSV